MCDPSRSLDDRAADVVARISLADKIQLLSGGQYPGGGSDPLAKGIPAPSIGLPPYNWWSEATHGLLYVQYSKDVPGASNTALPVTTSCSFNRTLWHATGNL